MTSPTPPTPTTTKDLVGTVLGTMAKSPGDPAAAAELARMAAGSVNKRGTVPTSTPPPPPLPKTPRLVTPDPFVTRPNGKPYYVRKMGDHSDVEALREMRRQNINPLYFGRPGNGKTALFEAAFADTGFEFIPGDGDTNVSDIVGGYIPSGNPDDPYIWYDGPLTRAMEGGLPLLVDEVALIDAKVMAVIYGPMDGRNKLRINANPSRPDIEAQPGFFVAGACNPDAPGANMSEALLSRFAIHIEMKTDFQLMRKLGVDAKLVTIAQNLEKKFASAEVGWFPGIRELLDYEKVKAVFGEDTALSNIISIAPEMDRPMVADAITRGFSRTIKGLEIK